MSKPTFPRWADTVEGDVSQVLEPPNAHKDTGWLFEEFPPHNFFNWLHVKAYRGLNFLDARGESNEPMIVRSNATVTWNAGTLTFAQPIDIISRGNKAGASQVNRIPAGNFVIADGSVVVLKRDLAGASPVVMASQAVYGNLVTGEFCVVAEASLLLNDYEHETILFRRRGTDLEVVPLGTIHADGSTFSLGGDTVTTPAVEVPIGSIIPFYDFNGGLTFDATKWKYCNGQVSDVGALLGQTLPDLSNRYLVGFGTEAGADIGGAAWATAAVGNASHQINIQHSHTVNAHSHTGTSDSGGAVASGGPSTNNTGNSSPGTDSQGSHTHTGGSLQFQTLELQVNATGGADSLISRFRPFDSAGNTLFTSNPSGVGQNGLALYNAGVDSVWQNGLYSPVGAPRTDYTWTAGTTGSTSSNGSHSHTVNAHNHDMQNHTHTGGAHTHTFTSNNSSPGTDNQLSASQSIQPRSIRVRFIMRVA